MAGHGGDFDYRVAGAGTAISGNFAANGYVVGVGWEGSLTGALSLRGEYLYSNFGSHDLADPATGASTRATPVNHQLRLVISRHF